MPSHLEPGGHVTRRAGDARLVAASMGIMLETTAERLGNRGGPHRASPDKIPARRLETMRVAGELSIPFTSGILIGIGEIPQERIDALLELHSLAEEHGHVREVIVQNFRAKPRDADGRASGRVLEEHLWSVAVARIVLGPDVHVQALPEPRLRRLSTAPRRGDRRLGRRLARHARPRQSRGAVARCRSPPRGMSLTGTRAGAAPTAVSGARRRPRPLGRSSGRPCDPACRGRLLACPGRSLGTPASPSASCSSSGVTPLRRATGDELGEEELVRLFAARGRERERVFAAADRLRREVCGDDVTYVVTRNVQYTNVCYSLRLRRVLEGQARREPSAGLRTSCRTRKSCKPRCARGLGARRHRGLPPGRDPPVVHAGDYYASVVGAIKAAVPEIHVHAFSALEIWCRARRRSESTSRRMRRGSATSVSARSRERRPRSSTTRCARSSARQGDDRTMARGPCRCASSRALLQRDDDVRPRRATRTGHATCFAREQSRSGGFTSSCRCRSSRWRRRSTPRTRPARPDVRGGDPGPLRRTARPSSRHPEHPGELGEARPDGARQALAGGERPRRDAHERVDLPAPLGRNGGQRCPGRRWRL